MATPKRVKIVEVGPRDGLQNESGALTADTKVEFIERLVAAGLRAIEVGSFVDPEKVPQMADTEAVVKRLQPQPDVHYGTLVPNQKGLERALACGVRDIAVFTATTDSFCQHNINCTVEESIQRFQPVVERARAQGLTVRGYISCVLGCPYEGKVEPAQVVRVAEALAKAGVGEISLGDTIGVGTPRKARAMVKAVAAVVPIERLALHFHDTYGQALANILTCLDTGVAIVDASVAGLGGCPYAPGASGNVATEDVVYMLNGLDIFTGVDLAKLVEAGRFITEKLNRPNESRVGRAYATRS
jgi:isopropylmalate/homocitrate/citramalate synthase